MDTPSPQNTTDFQGDQKINRREFLNYIWGASMALLLAEAGGGVAWYLSVIGGPKRATLISIDPAEIRKAGYSPVHYNPRLWLCNTSKGLYAFDDYCTHLGCTIKWVSVNYRFECPCHGAKFQLDGTYISGPAVRNLDSFRVTARTPQGTNMTPHDGGPVNIDGATSIEVDVLVAFAGKPRP